MAVYLIAGMFAGLVAGLLGVGGGIIVVPVLILVFETLDFSPAVLTHMAIATSLATIVFTSASSVWSHHQRGGVLWPVFRPMGLGISLGAIIGVLSVLQVDGEILKRVIGVFAIVVAIRMISDHKRSQGVVPPNARALGIAGVFIGWVSAMFGIGGGTLSVPFLSRYRLEMKQVVGTAAACGMPIALLGALTNALMGMDVESRPEWSLGYIYLPAVLGISLASVYFARIGASLAHRISAKKLKLLFAIALACVGMRFLLI